MNKGLIISLFSLLFLLALTACGVLSEPEAASAPIEAVPLELEEETAVPVVEEVAPTEEPMEEAPTKTQLLKRYLLLRKKVREVWSLYSIVPGESTVRLN